MSLEELDCNGKQVMRTYMEEGYVEIFVVPNSSVLSVLAGVVAAYICKWLDRED